MQDVILSIKNVSIAYESELAVSDVSFDVMRGDYFCVVGSNGSGKSSLIKGALGLVPLRSGDITLGAGQDRVAYLPQISTIPQDFPATVCEVVISGTQKSGSRRIFYSAEDYRAVSETLELLGISHLSRKRIGELSGGQKQRALLARALCRKPELLILDEPCSGLDEDISGSFYSLLESLNKDRGVTIFMISHDLDEIRAHAGRVAVLDNGLAFCGSVDEWRSFRGEAG